MSEVSGGLLLDREGLGTRIAQFILAAESRVVVLHGRPASGKTELLKRWVIRNLTAAGNLVVYGACEGGLPTEFMGPTGPMRLGDNLPTPCIVVLENFENIVALASED